MSNESDNDQLVPVVEDEEFHTLLFYQSIADALQRVSVHPPRPALPYDVTPDIMRFSNFAFPTYLHHSMNNSMGGRASFEVRAHYGLQVKRKIWFATRPFSSQILHKVKSVRLSTLSRHQGWVSLPDLGSWSWFELAILRSTGNEQNQPEQPKYADGQADIGYIKVRDDGSPLSWTSHHHRVGMSSKDENFKGMLFDAGHEIWKYLQAGDSIGVLGCARFGGWACLGKEAKLTFERFFEPIPLRER